MRAASCIRQKNQNELVASSGLARVWLALLTLLALALMNLFMLPQFVRRIHNLAALPAPELLIALRLILGLFRHRFSPPFTSV